MQKLNIFWFRRDLRLEDNTALNAALSSKNPVLTVFIFDTNITNELNGNDPRLNFIFDNIKSINDELKIQNSSVLIKKGNPNDIWNNLIREYKPEEVFYNADYEPYARKRDENVKQILMANGIGVHEFKDQLIFHKNDILKKDGNPYTVFTPYKNKWLKTITKDLLNQSKPNKNNFYKSSFSFPDREDLGIKTTSIKVKNYNTELSDYEQTRNFPALDKGSYLGPHLRFGTHSIRKLIQDNFENISFINELIWREFFMQILWHFPESVNNNFRRKYDAVKWRNNKSEFDAWCEGKTGYPIVDAGMRQLKQTAYMHNRVRMITAGFLCKHLLIDWRWGEAWFAKHLLDFELSSNVGNWQWAAGTGCDAAPYFRVFNPYEQQKKFDPDFTYIKKWVPEFDTDKYVREIVDHKFARERAIDTYRKSLIMK